MFVQVPLIQAVIIYIAASELYGLFRYCPAIIYFSPAASAARMLQSGRQSRVRGGDFPIARGLARHLGWVTPSRGRTLAGVVIKLVIATADAPRVVSSR